MLFPADLLNRLVKQTGHCSSPLKLHYQVCLADRRKRHFDDFQLAALHGDLHDAIGVAGQPTLEELQIPHRLAGPNLRQPPDKPLVVGRLDELTVQARGTNLQNVLLPRHQVLDVEDLVPGQQYILEISSPGLDRKLIKPADYERFVGRLAKIWTSEPVRDLKFFEGRLAGHADGIVKIAVKGRELEIVEVPFAAIRKANLVVEF